MDIAALSMVQAQNQVLEQVGTAVLSNSMETQETMGDAMVSMMEKSVTPNLGQTIDLRV